MIYGEIIRFPDFTSSREINMSKNIFPTFKERNIN